MSAETDDVRDRLLALTDELDAAAQRLRTLCAPPKPARLAAVADPPAAVAPRRPRPPPTRAPRRSRSRSRWRSRGCSRAEVHARLAGNFAIADPDAILDEVYGAG